MEEKEITLDELVKRTGFSKRQVYNWQKAGLLPEPVRREKTGRVNGEIVYYPIEAYYRLRSLIRFPISSVTKTIGIEGMFLPLFLFGFRDEKIDAGIKRLFKKAFQHFRKFFNKKLKEKDIDELMEEPGKDLMLEILGEDLPKEIIKPVVLKMTGATKKEIKTMLPEDTSNEIYDGIFNFGDILVSQFETTLGITYNGNLSEDFMNVFRQLAPKFPSFKEAIEQINRLNEQELNELQAGIQMVLGLFVTMGVPAESFLNLFKKTSFIYGLCLIAFFNYVIFRNFKSQFMPEIRKEILAIPENTRKVSMHEDEIKKKKVKISSI